ncbi:MAG TPA: adenosylmethionine--8-amino-7-oxononanoate transaminase [Candidatus Dormibacteraeota bacterium]|nr:adenosylmethionine--8-amino-7-oxononanoate transaminase [Candidatus Dormibacteraeota bacterium]
MSKPTTAELAAWDRQYLWHPFTQMRDWLAEEPIVIERGEGNYLIDTEGNRYLDGVSSLWCNVHGHRKRELDEALAAQTARIAHSTMLGLANVPATVLARRLIELAPAPLSRVFYSDAGATAVEIALKLALQYWQLRSEPRRTRFVALTEAYHGDTLGAVGVGYSATFHRFFRPVITPALRIDPPHVFRWQQHQSPARALELAIADAERVFAAHGGEVAALIVEPLMQGAAGMWAQPLGYLPALRELTRRHGALLICDEVATGFGRTGRLFAVEHEGVAPDLLCLGKGITGGYLPLAATLTSEAIFDAFLAPYERFEAFFHGHTYTGNPLACAVALANLDVFAAERVVPRVAERAAQLAGLLGECAGDLPWVGDVRQWGLMVGLELVRDAETRAPFDPALRVGHRVVQAARRHGVMLRPLGNVVILMPPLSITPAELENLVRVTAEAIQSVLSGIGQ